MKFTLRVETDQERIVRYHERCIQYAPDLQPADFGPRARWLVAKPSDGKFDAGYAGMRIDDTTAHVVSLGVFPTFRGHRLQVQLRSRLERWARRQGATRVETYCACDNIASMRNIVRGGYLPTKYWDQTDRPKGNRFITFVKEFK